MVDAIIIGILAALLGGAIYYIVKAKKNGAVCIGCSASSCPHRNQTGSGCKCSGK